MNKLLLTTAIITMLTSTAFADTIHQSGVGNKAIQGNGNYSPIVDSYNPYSVAQAGSSSESWSNGQAGAAAESSSNNSVSVREDAQKRNPVSTAYAAPLVTSDETCAYSTSLGVQFIGTGGSIGSTHEAVNCVRLKNSRELERRGYKKASIALLCKNEEIAEAMETAGTPCPAPKVTESRATISTTSSVDSDVPVRAR